MTPKNRHYIPEENSTSEEKPNDLEKTTAKEEKPQETINKKYSGKSYPTFSRYFNPRRINP